MVRSTRRSSIALLSVASLAAAVALAACGGKPVGTSPDVLTHCQLVFANQGTTTGRFDVYVLDMPIEEWAVSGEKTYNLSAGQEIVGLYYDEMLVDTAGQPFLARAITTAGTFSLATSTTSAGASVQVTDDGSQMYWDLGANDTSGAQVGSGGVLNFNGAWSDPTVGASPTPAPGSTVSLTYMGQSVTLGQFTQYAVCYHADPNAFAPVHPAARAHRALRTQPLFRLE